MTTALPAKVQVLPKPWAKLQAVQSRKLLRIERRTLDGMREDVDEEVDLAIADLAKAPDQNEKRAMVAILALLLLRGGELRKKLAKRVRDGRYEARVSALGRLEAELTLGLERTALGAALDQLQRPTATADAGHAAVVADTLASAWRATALARILDARRREASVTKALEETKTIVDPRTRRAAATEVAQAYSDEHRTAAERVAARLAPHGDDVVGLDAGLLVRRWDAILDARVCPTCRSLDGDVVPLGQPFQSGYEPGFVHPFCRCQDSVVLLPNWKIR